MILSDRISYRQLSKFHRLRLHGRVLRMCALWFLRDFRNPTRTARGHGRSAAPAREWLLAAAVIRCTWHSRRGRFTAAKPLPSTPVATGRRAAIQDGARHWERLRDGEDDLDRAVRFSVGDAAVRDCLGSGAGPVDRSAIAGRCQRSVARGRRMRPVNVGRRVPMGRVRSRPCKVAGPGQVDLLPSLRDPRHLQPIRRGLDARAVRERRPRRAPDRGPLREAADRAGPTSTVTADLGSPPPAVVHVGQPATLRAHRQQQLAATYAAHPERFSKDGHNPRICRPPCGSTLRQRK